MADDPNPAEGGGDPPASSDDVTFAGKYKTPEALEQGFRELRGALEMDEIKGDLVGEKGIYRDHIALETAYKDLQKIQSRGKPAKPDPKPDPKPDAGGDLSIDGDDSDLDVDDILSRSGLKFDDLEAQWTKEHKLTDDQYAAIRKVNPGLSKKMIDHVAKGMVLEVQQAAKVQQELHQTIAKKLGVETGELRETLATMGASVPKEERAALNEAINDSRFALMAVDRLIMYHKQATDSDGSNPLISGDGGGGAPAGIRRFEDLSDAVKRTNEGDRHAAAALGRMKTEDILDFGRF